MIKPLMTSFRCCHQRMPCGRYSLLIHHAPLSAPPADERRQSGIVKTASSRSLHTSFPGEKQWTFIVHHGLQRAPDFVPLTSRLWVPITCSCLHPSPPHPSRRESFHATVFRRSLEIGRVQRWQRTERTASRLWIRLLKNRSSPDCMRTQPLHALGGCSHLGFSTCMRWCASPRNIVLAAAPARARRLKNIGRKLKSLEISNRKTAFWAIPLRSFCDDSSKNR